MDITAVSIGYQHTVLDFNNLSTLSFIEQITIIPRNKKQLLLERLTSDQSIQQLYLAKFLSLYKSMNGLATT